MCDLTRELLPYWFSVYCEFSSFLLSSSSIFFSFFCVYLHFYSINIYYYFSFPRNEFFLFFAFNFGFSVVFTVSILFTFGITEKLFLVYYLRLCLNICVCVNVFSRYCGGFTWGCVCRKMMKHYLSFVSAYFEGGWRSQSTRGFSSLGFIHAERALKRFAKFLKN